MKKILSLCLIPLSMQALAQVPGFDFHKIGEHGATMGQTAIVDDNRDTNHSEKLLDSDRPIATSQWFSNNNATIRTFFTQLSIGFFEI